MEPRSAATLPEFLASRSTFAELAPHVLDLLAARMVPRTFEQGQMLIRQGDAGDRLFVLEDGVAEVRLNDPEGRSHVLATVEGGEVLGEMALITGAPRNADVVATTTVCTWVLSAPDFHTLMNACPEIAVVLTNIVADRLGQAALDGLGGKVLEGYRITRPVGRGAMAVVYEAEETATGDRVALKMMSHRLTRHDAARERFEYESDLVQSLDDPAVARCRGRFPAYGTYFMVMEYLDGPNLMDLIHYGGPLPLAEIRKIVGALASALGHVHERGIVHGDIKPANVMLALSGDVKLTDFGIATACSELQDEDDDETAPVVGTPWYMAPEQFLQEPPAPGIDHYALGCVLWEMATSEPLFGSEDLVALIRRKRQFTLPPADSFRPDLDGALYDVLERSLRADASERSVDLGALAPLAGPVDPALVARVMEERGVGPG